MSNYSEPFEPYLFKSILYSKTTLNVHDPDKNLVKFKLP